MNISFSRRIVILAVCSTAVFAWAATTKAAPEAFKVALTGAQQVPPVETAGSGAADLTYDPATRMLTWSVSYTGLSGPATMAHFHVGGEGKNGPVAIWISKQGSPTESPIKGEATLTPEQAQQFAAGGWYVNVHTQAHPAGEIRGQAMPPKG
jgi:CHRD domain